MKSIQSILMIILAVFLIGMMPNLAGGKIIKIEPDSLKPYNLERDYVICPAYVTSADASTAWFWPKIKFPSNADILNKLIYYRSGTSGSSTSVYIYRSKMGQFPDTLGGRSSSDDTGAIIKVEKEIVPDHEIDTSWTYWVLVTVYNTTSYVHGIKIKFSIK